MVNTLKAYSADLLLPNRNIYFLAKITMHAKRENKTQAKVTEQVSEPDSEITHILGLSNKGSKITMKF